MSESKIEKGPNSADRSRRRSGIPFLSLRKKKSKSPDCCKDYLQATIDESGDSPTPESKSSSTLPLVEKKAKKNRSKSSISRAFLKYRPRIRRSNSVGDSLGVQSPSSVSDVDDVAADVSSSSSSYLLLDTPHDTPSSTFSSRTLSESGVGSRDKSLSLIESMLAEAEETTSVTDKNCTISDYSSSSSVQVDPSTSPRLCSVVHSLVPRLERVHVDDSRCLLETHFPTALAESGQRETFQGVEALQANETQAVALSLSDVDSETLRVSDRAETESKEAKKMERMLASSESSLSSKLTCDQASISDGQKRSNVSDTEQQQLKERDVRQIPVIRSSSQAETSRPITHLILSGQRSRAVSTSAASPRESLSRTTSSIPWSSTSCLTGARAKTFPVSPSPTREVSFSFTEYNSSTNSQTQLSPVDKAYSMFQSTSKMESISTSETNGFPKNEHLYKVLVIGELGTGKTSIIKRYVHQFFSQHYRATIGVDFALKVVHWDQNTVIRLQLWDIAGQERFGNMTRVYYKEAVGAFIVFDVTRASTFDSVSKWKQDLDAKVQLPDGNPIPCVLLANKCDQPKEGTAANSSKLDEYCKEKGFVGWFETSAKDNINIDDAAKYLVGTILDNDKWSGSLTEDADKLDLNGKVSTVANKTKNLGCC